MWMAAGVPGSVAIPPGCAGHREGCTQRLRDGTGDPGSGKPLPDRLMGSGSWGVRMSPSGWLQAQFEA